MDPSVVGLLVGFIPMSFGNPEAKDLKEKKEKNPHHWIFCRHSGFLFCAERRWRIPIAVRISVFTIVCRKRNSPSQTSNAVLSFPFVLETAFLLFFQLWTVRDAMISVFSRLFATQRSTLSLSLFFLSRFPFSKRQAQGNIYKALDAWTISCKPIFLVQRAKKKKKRLLKWGTDHGFNLLSCKSSFAKRQEDVRFALT